MLLPNFKVILVFFMISFSICSLIDFTEDELKNFKKSIYDSFVYHEGKREKIIPISNDNYNLIRFEEDKNWVCLMSWSNSDCSSLISISKPNKDQWAVLCSEVLQFLSDTHLEMPEKRLIQKLGLKPEDLREKKCFMMFYAHPQSIFRPSIDPEIDDEIAEIPINLTESTKHSKWFQSISDKLRKSYPFTGLGYTCDWSQGYCSYGFSEYIIKKDSEIKIKELLLNKEFINKYMKKKVFSVMPEIHSRFSVDKFNDQSTIPEVMYNTLFEAIRLSPSNWNHQNWKFLLLKKESKSFTQIMDTLVFHNRFVLETAPSIMAFVSKKVTPSERFNQYDIGIATGIFLLQAQNIGLSTHIIGGFEQSKVNEILSVPEDYEVMTLVGLGYSDSKMPQRSRKSLEDIIMSESFNSSYKLDL